MVWSFGSNVESTRKTSGPRKALEALLRVEEWRWSSTDQELADLIINNELVKISKSLSKALGEVGCTVYD